MDAVTPVDDAAVDGFHRSVVDALPEAVIAASTDGRITFANRAAETMFGYASAQLIGASLLTLVPPQPGRRVDLVQWLARWAAEPDPEQSRFLDLTARQADGTELHVEVRVRSGLVAGAERYFITVRDNTARRETQAALRDANLRAMRILLVAEDAVISVDADQKIIFFNPAAEVMFGYGVDEVIGQDLNLLLPPEMRDRHTDLLAGFGRSTTPSRMMGERSVVWGWRRSGQRFPVEAAITKVMSGGVMTYTAQLRDVTERDRERSRLVESERRIRAVFDHASEAIALLGADGSVLEINQAGQDLATSGHSLIGLRLWEAPWLGVDLTANPAAVEPFRDAIRAAILGEATQMTVELQRDGTPLPIVVRLTPIADGQGEVAYILAEGSVRAN